MLKTFSLIVALLFSTQIFAVVDLKSSNYSDSWTDLRLPGSGYDLAVTRAYNSRVLYNGIFGFGWCSDFETALDITPEGNIKLTECGAGLEILFTNKNFSEKDISKTVAAIMAKVKADNPSNPATANGKLEERLKSEPALRYEYAERYGINRQIADKTRFLANGIGPEYIEKNGSNFVRVNPEGSSQRFRLDGKLEKIFDKNGNYISFAYDGSKIRDITDGSGRKLNFSYTTNGKVKEIKAVEGIKAQYRFDGSDLIWAKNADGLEINYKYDDVHNLQKISASDKSSKEIFYDKAKDWVVGFRDVNGCKETYTYADSKDNPKYHYWANVEKVCKGKVTLKAKYEFWYEPRKDNTNYYLARSKTVENNRTTEISYNENARPLSIDKDGKVSKFEYYSDGLLKKKVGADGETTSLTYDNSFKKVSKVTRGNKSTEFTYDGKGNLVSARNSEGQAVSLGYDGRGRIVSIIDQAKRKLSIKYEERFGKPSFIEREGMGSISVTYNTKGEITKVKSAAGTSVAIQVATTFNNLLDLIQPAGVAISL